MSSPVHEPRRHGGAAYIDHAYLISYDIRAAVRLRRVHRHVQSHASQLLESLYLLVATHAQMQTFRHRLLSLLDVNSDSVLILRLDARQPLLLGGRSIPEPDILLLGGPLWQSVDDYVEARSGR